MPPRTFSFDVTGRRRGKFVVEYAALEPKFEYEVRLSVVHQSGRASAAVPRQLEPEKPAIATNVAGELRLAFQWLRDRFRSIFKRREG
jgi:hypothetical protein